MQLERKRFYLYLFVIFFIFLSLFFFIKNLKKISNIFIFNDFKTVYSSEKKEYEKINIEGSYIKENSKAYYKVFLPKNNKKTNAIIICPGGGYQYLVYKNEGINVAKWFQKQGFVAVVLFYRAPNQNNTEYPYNDLKETFKIVKNKAQEWNIDKIGVMGFSAGGHLAAFYSNKTSNDLRPDFTILYYPVISMKDEITHSSTKLNLINNKKELEKEYSVENLVSKNTPETFITYAKDDESVNIENSKIYAEKLKKYNIPFKIYEFKTGGHGFGWSKKYEYQKQNKENLLSWLKTL